MAENLKTLYEQPLFKKAAQLNKAGVEKLGHEKYEEAIEVDERAFSSVFSAARAYNSLGDRDRAAELYDRALELEPNHPDLKLEVAQFVLATDQERALVLANEVLELVPDSADAQRIAELAEQA